MVNDNNNIEIFTLSRVLLLNSSENCIVDPNVTNDK